MAAAALVLFLTVLLLMFVVAGTFLYLEEHEVDEAAARLGDSMIIFLEVF